MEGPRKADGNGTGRGFIFSLLQCFSHLLNGCRLDRMGTQQWLGSLQYRRLDQATAAGLHPGAATGRADAGSHLHPAATLHADLQRPDMARQLLVIRLLWHDLRGTAGPRLKNSFRMWNSACRTWRMNADGDGCPAR